jgi:hypothetical protein
MQNQQTVLENDNWKNNLQTLASIKVVSLLLISIFCLETAALAIYQSS